MRFRGVCVLGIPGLGKGHVQVGQRIHGAADEIPLLSNQSRKGGQDALHLLLLVELQLSPVVVQLHHRQGLDEERGPAGRLIMDQPRDAPFELRLEGDDVATTALGDVELL